MGGFNPSVGILGGQTRYEVQRPTGVLEVSIPQSGFLVVKPESCRLRYRRVDQFQSLSRDSWWSNLKVVSPSFASSRSFNPSVGILGGQTRCSLYAPGLRLKFQSLSRDSWWSNQAGDVCVDPPSGVSIPQSGFLVVKLTSSVIILVK